MDVALVAFVVAVVLVASTAQTLVGFGFALIAVPLFVVVLDVRDTVVITTLLALLNSSLVARHAWRHVPWRTVSWLFAGSLAGMPIGLAVLLFAPEDALRFGVGVSTIVMTAVLASGLTFGDGGVGSELVDGVGAEHEHQHERPAGSYPGVAERSAAGCPSSWRSAVTLGAS
jgi:uncharacterized membrane protein YfcA